MFGLELRQAAAHIANTLSRFMSQRGYDIDASAAILRHGKWNGREKIVRQANQPKHRFTALAHLAAVSLCMTCFVETSPSAADSDNCASYDAPGSAKDLQRIQLRIHNATESSLACDATLAHWFSQGLGVAAPGEILETWLCHDRATGVLSLPNVVGDLMPVEAVWCGRTNAARTPAARIPLPHAAGPAPERILRWCADGMQLRLRCAGGEF